MNIHQVTPFDILSEKVILVLDEKMMQLRFWPLDTNQQELIQTKIKVSKGTIFSSFDI